MPRSPRHSRSPSRSRSPRRSRSPSRGRGPIPNPRKSGRITIPPLRTNYKTLGGKGFNCCVYSMNNIEQIIF